jgi:hypothetical protein
MADLQEQVKTYTEQRAFERQARLLHDHGISAGVIHVGGGRYRLTHDPEMPPRGLGYRHGAHR